MEREKSKRRVEGGESKRRREREGESGAGYRESKQVYAVLSVRETEDGNRQNGMLAQMKSGYVCVCVSLAYVCVCITPMCVRVCMYVCLFLCVCVCVCMCIFPRLAVFSLFQDCV